MMGCLLACMLIITFYPRPGMAQPQSRKATRSSVVQLLANWLLAHRDADSGLPISHVGDRRFENWCFTYDASVSALALIALDRPEDARRIVDFYMNTPHTHRLGGIIEAVNVRPPCVGKDWSVRTGANLWLGLAAYHLFEATGDDRHRTFAIRIGDFALGLQDSDDRRETFGGMRLGPKGDPTAVGDQHFGYDPHSAGFEQVFSTEATIDAFALFNLLQAEPGLVRFRNGRDRCLRWLRQVAWNTEEHRFNRGFGSQPDFAVASDTHAWGISALGVKRLDTIETGAAEKLMRFVEQHCLSTVIYHRPDGTAVSVKGVDFVDHQARASLRRPPLVSPEWTFQMANAYKRLADDFGNLGDHRRELDYAEKRDALLTQIMAAASIDDGAAGFPYATLDDAPIGHEYRTPEKGNLSMIGVSYGILAWTGFDPLRPSAGQEGKAVR